MSKKSTLTYNSGAIKFKNTNADFKTYQITPSKTIGQLLSLVENNVYDLFYFKDIDEYKIKDFFFFYENIVEDTKMDLSTLMVKDDSKTFLIFVEIDKNANLIVSGTYNWIGENPIFESGKKYLFLVRKDSLNGLTLTLIARTVEQDTKLSLTFRFTKGSNMELDLTSMFPNEIHGYYPKYSGKINWGDSDDVFDSFYNNKVVSHTYAYPENDNELGYCEYTVTITGICEGLGQVPFNCVRCNEIKGVRFFGKCFSYCTKFEEFPETFFHGIGPQSELHGCFQGTKISFIPENLFPTNNKIKKIVSLFSECVFLNDVNSEESIIPEKLFKPLENLEELISVFDSSFYITKVPQNIFKYNPKLKNIDRCFAVLGLDKGSIDIDLSPSEQVINNIPDGIVDNLNIKRTEAVFSGLGLGRLLRHVDNSNNPHRTTLQQAYDDSEVTEGPAVKVKTDNGLILGANTPENTYLANLIDIDNDRVSIMARYNGKVIGFSTGFHNPWYEDPLNEVFGAPLKIEDATKDYHAVTLKQLREAELNHIELKGEWNPGNGDEELDKTSGSCYYVSTDGTFFDINWNAGDFLLFDSSSRAIKMEGHVTFKDIFESPSGNNATLTATKTLVNEDSNILFKVTNSLDESVQIGHSSGVGLSLSNGKIEVLGEKPLTLSSDPIDDLDAVTKVFLTNSLDTLLKTLKEGNNDGSFALEWSGNNYFSGGLDVGAFQFSKEGEDIQEIGSTYPVPEYRIRLENNGAKNIASTKNEGITTFELSYNKGHTTFPTTKSLSSISDGVYQKTITIESGIGTTHPIVVSETTEYNRDGDRFKKFTGNIEVSTDKEGYDNFSNKEFITKDVANEAISRWAESNFELVGNSREVNFDGNRNNAQANGCRFVLKNANISGLVRVSKLHFPASTSSGNFYTDAPIMIGIYRMNQEPDTNESGTSIPKWYYPTKLVAYSKDENVQNLENQDMTFSHLVQATPREEEQKEETHLGITVSSPLALREPYEFIPEYKEEEIEPDDENNPGIYWDASEPMMVVFFKYETNENGEVRLPPIEGSFITKKTNSDGTTYQDYAINIVARFQTFSTVNYSNETQSCYVVDSGNWAFNPSTPKTMKYHSSNNCLIMTMTIKGVDELYAFGVNTTGKYLTGISNIWTGTKNDFYQSELTYKIATKDTEVVTVEYIKEKVYPIGFIYSTTVENSYPLINNTQWTLLETTTIGTKTVYYYERTL